MSVAPAAPPAVWVDSSRLTAGRLLSRVATFCLVELQKLRHDRTELLTRAIQPVLWLVVFGVTFSHIHAIPTGSVPYLDYLAPGIIAQSALFVAIFYGIQIIWERDAGVLTKLLVTPTPRAALVAGKAFAAGIRAIAQAVVVILVAALLGVSLTWNPIKLLGVVVLVVLGAAFFACLSVTIAGLVLRRDRLMGIGQAITMPLFFASNALYPVALMPAWLQALSLANPLTYEVSGLRGLLIGQATDYWLDFGVLTVAARSALPAQRPCFPAWPASANTRLIRMAQMARTSVTGGECWSATVTKVSLA
jgi:ABC-2 type transport system permease protein